MHAPPTSAAPLRRLLALLLSVAAVGSAVLATPAAADPGTYTVWSCRGPDGTPVSARAWQLGGSPIATMTDTCAAGGSLRVFVPAGRTGTYLDDAGARFQTLGGGAIVGYRLWRVTKTGGTGVGGGGFYTSVLEDDFGFSSVAVDSCIAPGCAGKGDASDPLGSRSLFARAGPARRSVSIAAGCSAPVDATARCVDGGTVNAAFDLYRSAIEIDDSAPPSFAGEPTGALLGGTAVGGRQTVAVPAEDAGAGVRTVQARVDGQLVAEADAGGDCREPYTRPSPCDERTTLAVEIDTTRLADGEHQLELTLVDGAGNAVAGPSRTVRIDNRPPPEPPEPPIPPIPPTPPTPPAPPAPPPVVIERDPPPPAVRGDYVVSLSRRRVVAGARTPIDGRVTDRAGAAEANASLILEQRRYGPFGGEWSELRTFRADAAGRFRFAVPGTAQQMRVRLAPARAASATFVSPPVDVLSRLSLRVTASPRALRNGGMLTIGGRVRGVGASARGKTVLVQAIVGGEWGTLDRVTADRRGAFRWRYRFQRTRTEALYSFRVVVAADGDRWPWPTTRSPRLRVRVRP